MVKSLYPTGYSFRKKKKPSRAGLLFSLLTLLVLLLSLSWMAAPYSWAADMLSHFPLYYLLAALFCCIMLLFYKRPTFALLAFCTACLQLYPLSHMWDFGSILSPLESAPSETASPLSPTDDVHILVQNINRANTEKSQLVAELEKQAATAEILVLLEVTPDWQKELETLQARFAYHLIQPRDDAFGYAVFSRVPTTSMETVHLQDGEEIPVIHAYTAKNLVPFTLFAAHSMPPLTPDRWRMRNRFLEELAQRVAQEKDPNRIVVGDFNLTPYSPWFARFEQQSGLTEAQRQFTGADTKNTGDTGTADWDIGKSWNTALNHMRDWNAGSWPGLLPPPLRIPIDHAFASPNIAVHTQGLGTYGSDHAAQLSRYTLPVLKPLAVQEAQKEAEQPKGNHVPASIEDSDNQFDLESEMPAAGMPTLRPLTSPHPSNAAPPAGIAQPQAVQLPPIVTAEPPPKTPPHASLTAQNPAPRKMARHVAPAASYSPVAGTDEEQAPDAHSRSVEYQDDLERRIAGTR